MPLPATCGSIRSRLRPRAAPRPGSRRCFCGGACDCLAAARSSLSPPRRRHRQWRKEADMPDTALLPPKAGPIPALSIVIPVYNGADSIAELVAALEALEVAGGHEIVLVNDGSPDDSLA